MRSSALADLGMRVAPRSGQDIGRTTEATT
jgi:hypothetical protein